ncbi:MAG: helicase HerA-like domain-containing protein [Pyrinomonadaceae bacterium]
MTEPILVAKKDAAEFKLLMNMSNRHGVITGATGTGKTVTLQRIAEGFSERGVPVFLADIKGDLTGISQAGGNHPKILERLTQLGFENVNFVGSPVTLWDVFGKQGHPLRATISEMGPLLLSRLLQLNDTQEGVLTVAFKEADESGLLLLDLKDLQSLLQHIGENASELTLKYGNVSKATVGAILRGLLTLEQQQGEQFFGEPAVKLNDFMQTIDGKGVLNLLAADDLINSPKVYSTFLLWILSELFENLPEAGDLEKPKLVFIFDEAHLLFSDAPGALVEKIEQVVRLIRSKGVGVYFVTQSPADIPDKVLAQLGNRVQHALRAYTPKEQEAVKVAAKSFRVNPELDVVQTITELGVGEVLISMLDEKGIPAVVNRAFVVPPVSQIGPITPEQRAGLLSSSIVAGQYEQDVDRESAFEILAKKTAERVEQVAETEAAEAAANEEAKAARGSGSRSDSVVTSFIKSAARSTGTSIAREITRGILGGIFGGSTRSRKSSWF